MPLSRDPLPHVSDSPPARAIAGHVSDRNELRGVGPAAAAQIRRLLELPAEATDDEVRRAVANRVAIAGAALDVGFSATFRQAVAGGRADPAHHDFWRDVFLSDPQQTREFLSQTWRQAR